MTNTKYRVQIVLLFALSLLTLSLMTGCQSLHGTQSVPVTTTVQSGTIQISGPFSSVNDQVSIHAISIYEEDYDQVIAGERTSIGSTYVKWNDEIVFAITGMEGTLAFLESLGNIPEYDYVHYRGYCLRESNGLMSLIFSGNFSGTVNASRPDDLFFVYYDHDAKGVTFKEVSEGFLNTQGCVDSIEAYRALSAGAVEAEKQLVSSFLPPGVGEDHTGNIGTNQLPVTELSSDPRSVIQNHFEQYRDYYKSAQCDADEKDDIPEQACLQNSSQFSLVVKHPEYEIYRLEFIHDCSSLGVDLLRTIGTDNWYHLYSIPTGCSKHFLFYPEYKELSADRISLELCTYCFHWGAWDSFVFDLPEMVIRKVYQ